MPSLIQKNSPLAQAARTRAVAAPGSAATTQTPTHDLSRPVEVKANPRRRSRATLRPAERETLRRLLTEKYEYVDHEWFHQPEDAAYQQVFLDPDPLPLPDVSWYHPLMDPGTADAAALARNASGGGSVLLTAAQERVLFTQFNYCRMQVCLRRDQLLETPDAAGASTANKGKKSTQTKAKPPTAAQKDRLQREMLDWYVRADALRTQVADTNLALVLAMAKRSRIFPGDFADLISEGNMALLRAADKFDVGRGFKFSTYACRAILKAFSRQGIKLSKHRQMFPMDFDPKLERSNYQSEKNAAHEDDCADEVRRIVVDNRAELSDVERTVVAARFNVAPLGGHSAAAGAAAPPKPVFKLKPDAADESDAPALDYELPASLRGRSPDAKPLTLEQVGKLIGVTKERVRQIQNKALEKIRQTLEEDYLG